MKEHNYKEIKESILLILNTVQQNLDDESVEAVNHYINHDEYEMAFEGLFIEIMKLDKIPTIDFLKSREIGQLLNLNEESVFDFEFWKKFEEYVVSNHTK